MATQQELELVFRQELTKTLATADGFTVRPFGEADIPFDPNSSQPGERRNYDSAEAFIRRYNDIVKDGAAQDPKELAGHISGAYFDTLGKVAHKPHVREWSRRFFERSLVCKDEAARQRLNELLSKPAFDDRAPPAMQISDMMARVAILPLTLTVDYFKERSAAREVERRLARARPVTELERACKELETTSVRLARATEEYNRIAQYLQTGEKEIFVRLDTETGHWRAEELKLSPDSEELKKHVKSLEKYIESRVNLYRKDLDDYKSAYAKLKDMNELGSLNAESVGYMTSTALVMDSSGALLDGEGKSVIESLKGRRVEGQEQRVGSLAESAKIFAEKKMNSPHMNFVRFAEYLPEAFDKKMRNELREQARVAGHAVLQFDMDRAGRCIDRAQAERRALNGTETTSVETALKDGKSIAENLNKLLAEDDKQMRATPKEEYARMQETMKFMEELQQKAAKADLLNEKSGEKAKELLESLKKMDPAAAIKALVDKLSAVFGMKEPDVALA